jgi:hypothetical protein
MKNILFICLSLVFGFLSQELIAQAPPQKMTYQFIARNAQNQLIQNNAVGLRISILQGSTTGNAVYVETHTPQTNGNGTATIEVGGGTVVSGVFANIDWSTGVYFIQTEMDPQGQQGYSVTAVSQLLSVPYAFYAGRATYADSVSGGMSETDPTFNASVAASITAADTARWNQDLVNDADSDPTNELQTLSVVGDSVYLSGSGGSFSVSDGDTSLWKVDNFGIHYDQGNVGIGTSSDPISAFSILKDVGSGSSRYFMTLNNISTTNFSNVAIKLRSGSGTGFTELNHYSPTYTAIPGIANYGGITGWGNGLLFNVADSMANFRFARGGGNNTVVDIVNINKNGGGIGTDNPIQKLHVLGSAILQDENGSPHIPISFLDNSGFTRGQFRMISDPTYSILEIDALEPTPSSDVSIRFFRYTNTTGIKSVNFLRGNSSAQMSASIGVDGTNSYFQIHGGNVGVGTTTPRSKLEVQAGDIYINNISSGVIMKSPNGSCWRVTVDNTGNLVRTAIVCP